MTTVGEITITINGVEVKTRPGAMIIQAAMEAGMYIPYLCYYPGMKPYGACRMCVVTAESRTPDGEYRALPGSPASCTTPVADGMRVTTNSEGLTDLRRGIMELLIAEHPHGCLTCHRIDLCGPSASSICLRHVSVNDRCLTCPKNERCELKDTVRHLEMEMDTPLTYNNRHLPLATQDPYWEMDMNLCIVCARCVRVCDEVRGDDALTLQQRSGRSLIGTSQGNSLLESGCEFCGACIDVCPTGALVERDNKWEKAVETITSICPHCPVGCQMTLEINKRNRMIRAIPDRNAEANRGQACFKGKFGLDFVNNRRELIKRPLVRRDGELREASWHDALDVVAERLGQHKGDQFALIASPRGTNEDNYLAQKFARSVMQTNNVDVSSNLRPELTPPLADMLGYSGATNPIWELENSSCFLVVSSNITEEQNVAAVPIKMAVKNGASLIVIDQRETELTRYANVWLRPRPGSETALIGGMLRVILDESLDDHDFVSDSCEGLEEFRRAIWSFDLLKVERTTGVPQARIQEAARLFAAKAPGAVLYALETLAPELRDECVRALVNLALITGNFGKASTGLYPLFSGANEQGSKDVGCSPGHLPGYAALSDSAASERFREAWGAAIPTTEGIGIRDIAAAIRRGEIRALQVIGDSPNFTNGELEDFLGALECLDFLLVQDTFPNELTELADVVLPSATFATKDGTYTNMERRVQLLRPALGPKAEEEADWRIICRIAERMSAPGFAYEGAESIFAEISDLVDGYAGLSHERLRSGGLQWPCAESDSPGPPVVGESRARLSALTLSEQPEREDAAYPFLLARGRLLHQPERDAGVELVDSRNLLRRTEIIELHEEDAREIGVSDGEWIEVAHSQGVVSGIAQLSSPLRGVISTTTLFGALITDLEGSKLPDPMLKAPGLPLLPARIQRAVAPAAD